MMICVLDPPKIITLSGYFLFTVSHCPLFIRPVLLTLSLFALLNVAQLDPYVQTFSFSTVAPKKNSSPKNNLSVCVSRAIYNYVFNKQVPDVSAIQNKCEFTSEYA